MDKINRLMEIIKEVFKDDSSGHDYWHSVRVYENAMRIAESECCDKETVAIAALLHDVDDAKLFKTENYANARQIMTQVEIEPEHQDKVIHIIGQVSFRGSDSVCPDSIEGKIVQDADRLDAIGAIGIARAFSFGGSKGRIMYDPSIAPDLDLNTEKYLKNQGTVVNHFYEKLFFLADMMNTDYAKTEAQRRTSFMKDFLKEFFDEWHSHD